MPFKNKEDRNANRRKYYQEHKEEMRAKRRARVLNNESNKGSKDKYKAKMKLWLNEIKNVPCMDCGILYPTCVMDFDHVRGVKLFGISTAVNQYRTKETIEAEIDKCELVCSNCHRIRTNNRRQAALKM